VTRAPRADPPRTRLRGAFASWRRLGSRLDQPFPVVDGNALRSLERKEHYFDLMRRSIANARRTVDVEMYLWEDDEVGASFSRALAEAARRGVAVRVLADAFGARDALDGSLRATSAAGASVRAFNPFRLPAMHRFYHRTHKKLLVVDDTVAFTGGAGFSYEFSGVLLRGRPWHDRMFEIRGPLVAQLADTFDADFGRWRPRGSAGRRETRDRAHCGACGTARGRALRGWPDPRDFTGGFLRAVERAQERVWIGTPYFLPPWRLRAALRGAARRGIDVQVVVPSGAWANPGLWYASRRHYGGFLRQGVRIHEFRPAFYHAKLAVVDGDHAFIGSSNMDSLSWRRNAELDLVFHDAATVSELADLWFADCAVADEVTIALHRERGLMHRAFERFAGLFDDWL
jgi:phosphatidylserine/phosphatidylglycerophosphate/cardiolipin synthase-like enzyme